MSRIKHLEPRIAAALRSTAASKSSAFAKVIMKVGPESEACKEGDGTEDQTRWLHRESGCSGQSSAESEREAVEGRGPRVRPGEMV